MRKNIKKLIGIALASTMALATLAGCSGKNFTGNKLDGFDAAAAVSSNGGFVAKKGDYVYFINGQESNTADNTYGEVTKGALLRIKASDLTAGNYGNTDVVVPMLFVAQNFDAGIYLYGDSVYYATPTTDKDLDGNVENTLIDFKSAKLDGSEAMKSKYFQLTSNSVQYRYVQDKTSGVVYCLYVDGTDLHSFNTQSGKDVVLVKGAEKYYFDETDAESGNVYYTMKVTENIDSDNSHETTYNQIYMVNATATATTNASEASYTVAGGKTYDFDKSYMEEKNAEAKEAKTDEPYDFDDYSTYPYVNLGTLVLDGIGSFELTNTKTQYNDENAGKPSNIYGYTYAIQSYENGGLYFTRKANDEGTTLPTYLYYVANATVAGAEWKSVSGNTSIVEVTKDTTTATADAVYYIENGAHGYLYQDGSKIWKVEGANKFVIEEQASSVTLWKTEGEYLYYYAASTNGNNVSRIKYTSDNKDDYHKTFGQEEYHSVTIDYVDWNSAWYKPEIIDGTLIYSNAQSFGSVAYNYIYAVSLDNLTEKNEAYKAAQDKITEIADGDTDVENVLNYMFRTGKTDKYDEIKDGKVGDEEYFDEDQKAAIATFVDEMGKTASYKLSYYINQIGGVKSSDAEEINQMWVDFVTPDIEEETTATEEKGLETWAIVLIVVGSVIVAAGIAVGVIFLVKAQNKKKEAARKAAETVNLAKRKIDTTDDKSIDVYADETETVETEEVSEENVEEVVEAEEVAEEAVEEAAEVEATEEAAEEPKQD